MTRRGSRTRLWLFALGALLLAVNALAFATFTWPRLNRVRSAESRAREVTDRKAALERLWAEFAERKELVAQNRKDIEVLLRDHLKSRAEDLFAAQREIERLAREAGLRPKTSTYAIEEIKGAGLVRCAVSLPLDGSYRNLMAFLARIESAKRFIVVDQMALAQDDEGAKMTLKLSAIFKDEDVRASR